jgi:hypothetical protein
MQADDIFPKGWHFAKTKQYQPGDPLTSKSLMLTAPVITRSLGRPTYILIDFGNAVRFRNHQPPFISGLYGYNYPPEMKPGGICNAYRAEIWCLGFMIQEIVDSVREF